MCIYHNTNIKTILSKTFEYVHNIVFKITI